MKIETKWILICAIGGVLMLFGTTSGLFLFNLVMGLYSSYGVAYLSSTIGEGATMVITIIITTMIFIMAGGGVSVLIGSVLIFLHIYKIGKLIIALGSGMGTIGIMMFLIWEASFINPVETLNDFVFFILNLFMNLYFIGVVLALLGRKKMKKYTDEEYGEKLLQQATAKHDKEVKKLYEKIICPVCNTENPEVNKFCRKCGTELKYSLDEYL